MKIKQNISYSADSAKCLLDVYLPDRAECEPGILITCSENDMVNRVNQNRVLITAMLQFGFPQEKLTFQIYERETHCSYMEKDFFLQDELHLIRRACRTAS